MASQEKARRRDITNRVSTFVTVACLIAFFVLSGTVTEWNWWQYPIAGFLTLTTTAAVYWELRS